MCKHGNGPDCGECVSDFGRRQGQKPSRGCWPKFLGERVANGYSVARGRQALANEKVEIILEGRTKEEGVQQWVVDIQIYISIQATVGHNTYIYLHISCCLQ